MAAAEASSAELRREEERRRRPEVVSEMDHDFEDGALVMLIIT